MKRVHALQGQSRQAASCAARRRPDCTRPRGTRVPRHPPRCSACIRCRPACISRTRMRVLATCWMGRGAGGRARSAAWQVAEAGSQPGGWTAGPAGRANEKRLQGCAQGRGPAAGTCSSKRDGSPEQAPQLRSPSHAHAPAPPRRPDRRTGATRRPAGARQRLSHRRAPQPGQHSPAGRPMETWQTINRHRTQHVLWRAVGWLAVRQRVSGLAL